jgi:hypothetical protein
MNRSYMNRYLPAVLLAVGASLSAFGDPIAAQATMTRSRNTGLTLGLGLVGTSLTTKSGSRSVSENGVGVNFEAGWGFSPRFSVYLDATGSAIDSDVDYAVGQGELGLRYMFRATDKKARPYVEGGLAVRQLHFDFEDGTGNPVLTVKSTSGGVVVGGGVQIFFHPRVALDIGATVAPGRFSDWKANSVAVPVPDIDATSTNVRLGVRFWPTGK